MPTKQDDIAPIEKIASIVEKTPDVENVPPSIIWSSFDEFFNSYAKENNVNKNWAKVVKQHVKDLGVLKDQSKWLWAVKHFGI